MWIGPGTANPDCDSSEAITLRASRKRPRRHRASDQRDELTPPHGAFPK
jgi:hypothetical protein